jgi:hypothetical protein
MRFLQHRATVITLVGHHLFHSLLIDAARRGLRLFQRFVNRARVALVGCLQRHGHQRSACQIHGMFGLVRQVRTPILHLRDARIRVAGAYPLLIGSLLLSLPVQPHQLFPRRVLDTRRGARLRSERGSQAARAFSQ